jgi:hypothetical protein
MIRKAIKGYEGLYEVNTEGNVHSLNYNRTGKVRELKPGITRHGYYYVILCKDGKKKLHTVHRLVAEAFIDNPENKSQVDHKDRNKLNNKVDNLRWASHSENCLNTKSKNIYKNGNGYQVRFQVQGVRFDKTFKTYEEACLQRDAILYVLNEKGILK